jgi:hypothetical protein
VEVRNLRGGRSNKGHYALIHEQISSHCESYNKEGTLAHSHSYILHTPGDVGAQVVWQVQQQKRTGAHPPPSPELACADGA